MQMVISFVYMNPNKWIFKQMEIQILISSNEVHLNDHVQTFLICVFGFRC
jgi:hypothetical protein